MSFSRLIRFKAADGQERFGEPQIEDAEKLVTCQLSSAKGQRQSGNCDHDWNIRWHRDGDETGSPISPGRRYRERADSETWQRENKIVSESKAGLVVAAGC
jgi:hypothetical protein